MNLYAVNLQFPEPQHALERVVFVGEVNPYGSDPFFALFHLPRNASGNRLRRIVGLTDASYVQVRKVNLCDGEWSAKAARERAAGLLAMNYKRVFVALGARVRAAFASRMPLLAFEQRAAIQMNIVVGLPHPSGRCRDWNVPGSFESARQMLAVVAPEIQWGGAADTLYTLKADHA